MGIIKTYKRPGAGASEFPAMALTKRDPKLAAMVSKAERGINPVAHDADGNRRSLISNTYAFRSILQKRAKRNSDAAAIVKLLPDIELSSQILVSSIISPKDMMSTELIYTGPKTLLSSELSSSLLNRLREHFDETYRVKDKIADMIREPLFEKGSYPIAVIPENAIDEIINGSKRLTMEELSTHFTEKGAVRNLGILGNHLDAQTTTRLGIVFENLKASSANAQDIDQRMHYLDADGTIAEWSKPAAEDYLLVVDNPNVLKIPKLNEIAKTSIIQKKFSEGRLKSGFEVSMEGYHEKGLSDVQVERAMYRTRQISSEPIVTAKSQHALERRSVGSPLIMKLPSESVLPVHVPGNPEHHIGYFVLLDEEGNPLSAPDNDQLHPGLKNDAANSVGSNLIKKASLNMGTGGDSFDPMNPMHVRFAQQIYADMVERDLINRVKNGVHSSSVAIAKNEEVYRLMLSRVLARKYTQLLYLPMEYMTYIAFKYGDDGVGRSMLDDQAMINTLRSVLLFSDVMASVKNSIGRTKVTGTLPENDPNPMKTLEMVMDEIVRSRTLGIPLGVSNPADVMEFIQRAGYEWDISGNKGLPDVKFDFQQTSTSYAKPDQDLTDHLRKASIMGFGISPETVDNGFNAEFATTAVANNILLSKRVVMHQDKFCPQLSDHLRKVAMHTEDLLVDLRGMLENNFEGINLKLEDIDVEFNKDMPEEFKKKLVVTRALSEFISNFTVTLPRPSSVTLENQLVELKVYVEGLDVALDAYITSDMFTTTVTGELSNEANTVRSLLKAYFIRKWMADKGIMTEVADLVMSDDKGNPQLNVTEEVKHHLEAMSKTGVMTLVGLQPNKLAVDKDLKEGGVVVGDNSETESGDYSSGSSGDTGGAGDDFDLGGDIGGDLGGDTGTMDEVPEDEDKPVEDPDAADTPPADDIPAE